MADSESEDSNHMDSSLLNKETDAGVFLEDFIYETNRVNKFFLQNLRNIRDELKQFKEKFEVKKRLESHKRANRSAQVYQEQLVLGQERDEFEFAVSWKRAFSQIYLKITWLNSFALTNQITC